MVHVHLTYRIRADRIGAAEQEISEFVKDHQQQNILIHYG
jgi:hypothetical protein